MARIPLSYPYNPRTTNTNKDSRRLNVMDEKAGERTFTLKRPGLVLQDSLGAGPGQGIMYYNDLTYSIVNDVLNVSGSQNSGANGQFWTQAANAPWTPRAEHKIVQCAGVTYMIGGADTNGNALNDVWSTQQGQDWKCCTAAAPWSNRYDFAVGYIGSTIYVIGGNNPALTPHAQTDVWSSDDGVNWNQITTNITALAPNIGCFAGGAISADNGIYLMGGVKADGTTLTDATCFSVDGITWTYVNDGALDPWGTGGERVYPSTWYYHNKLWIGGGLNATTYFNNVYYSSDAGKTWTRSTNSAWSAGRFGSGCIVYGNKMWNINGQTAAGPTLSHQVYSSTDGITWTLVTAVGPMSAASVYSILVVFPTPDTVSQYHYDTIYCMGGFVAAPTNQVWYGNLNSALSTTVSLSATVPGQQFQFCPFNEGRTMLLKNQTEMWVFSGSQVFKVTDTGYPLATVQGLVALGSFAYVMQTDGLIRNCNLDDPFHWPMLNAVAADYDADDGIVLLKYLNYVVALGEFSTQFFYDAGVSPGSPLLPYLSASMMIGCEDANSVQYIGPSVIWVSRTKQSWRQVLMLNGMTPQTVSTAGIEKLITNWNTIYSWSVANGGHLFYVICSGDDDVPAMAYDFTTKEWYEWSRADDATKPLRFVGSAPTEINSINLLLHPTNGNVYGASVDAYNDDGVEFPVILITDKQDAGNNYNKFCGQITVIADQNPGTPGLSWTDDDYNTYCTPRTVDMNTQRPDLYRNGKFRRRAFKYTQQDSNPMRLEALEIEVEQGK